MHPQTPRRREKEGDCRERANALLRTIFREVCNGFGQGLHRLVNALEMESLLVPLGEFMEDQYCSSHPPLAIKYR